MAAESTQMRTEKDSMGEMRVPSNALYGASTQRAVENFQISGRGMPVEFIRAIGLLKYACAQANGDLGLLESKKADLIKKAAWEVYEGKHDDHFPVDVFQTGSATSSNMNCNEVVSNRCSQLAGEAIGSKKPIHPNDDVNMGQSSNDTMPSSLHISVALALRDRLMPALERLENALQKKSDKWKSIVKIGRTHLMDATPITLGQEFSGYAAQAGKSVVRVEQSIDALMELAIGGTAVGTGINCHSEFTQKVVATLNDKTQMQFRGADNHFEAQAARDDCAEVAGNLSTICASLTKIANDIRLMGSGPRSGLGELALPATQPGSSIMPGKVNPVMPEMLVQVCLYCTGLCQSVFICARDGHFELNVTIPTIGYALLDAINCLTNGVIAFVERCVEELEPNEDCCKELVERSLMLVTALNPYIGYDKAAYVAKRAFKENRTLREILIEEALIDEDKLDDVLNPMAMTSN